MVLNREIEIFDKGVCNLLSDEIIPQEAASDSQNWYTQEGRIKLVAGRAAVGAEGPAGMITGEILGYKIDGTQVHWRKSGANIQYLNGTTWITTITGLTVDADYSFSNYSSLAGAFTFAVGVDGIFKMNNASPGNYIALYDKTKNFKGLAMIDKARMLLWGTPTDKTGLYGSHIEPSDGSGYTDVSGEATTSLGGTLAFKAGDALADAFNVGIAIPIAAPVNVSAINLSSQADVQTSGAHGLNQGDYVLFAGLGGMTQLNGLYGQVLTVVSSTEFTMDIDTTTFTPYTSGGTAAKAEYFKDDYLGNLKGNISGTGTINYITGVYTVTTAGIGVAQYQWEDSNAGGITDFTETAGARVAGDGFIFRQDIGGDPILNVLVGLDEAYYSIKSQSIYRLAISADDLTADNNVFRQNIGIPSWRGATSIQLGIVIMNIANTTKPEMTLIQKNPVGDNVEPKVLFEQFKFANYDFSDMTMDNFERYILVACKTLGSATNNTLLLCNPTADTVDITGYAARTFAKDASNLYCGSPITMSIYNLFSGFDDMGFTIENYWDSKNETFAIPSRSLKYAAYGQSLKKYRKIRLKGLISKSQSYGVYVDFDDAGWQLVGTVLGNASYVDISSPQTVGGSMVGASQVGGGTFNPAQIVVYPYFAEIRLKKIPKFRKRKMRLVALGMGYVDCDYQSAYDITLFEEKLPARFRQKQNVSIDGTQTDLPTPEF